MNSVAYPRVLRLDAGHAPGSWKPLEFGQNSGQAAQYRLNATITCPHCSMFCTLIKHGIQADGCVQPSVQCPNIECTFHEYVQLEGWQEEVSKFMDRMMQRKIFGIVKETVMVLMVALHLMSATPALAQPAPVSVPDPAGPALIEPGPLPVVDLPEDGLLFDATAWSKVAISSDADTSVKFGGGFSVDGPLAFGTDPHTPVLRVFVHVDMEALPEKTLDFVNIGSWGNAAEVGGGVYRRVGEYHTSGQHITTSAVVMGDFATSLNKAKDPETGVETGNERRFYRSYGIGLRLAEENAGFLLLIYYGRDEAVGQRGYGQLMVRGQVPIRSGVRFVARAGLGLGTPSLTGLQSDYLTAGIAVSVSELARR